MKHKWIWSKNVAANSNMLLRDVGYGKKSCCTTYIHSENVVLPHIEFQKWSFFFLFPPTSNTNIHNHFLFSHLFAFAIALSLSLFLTLSVNIRKTIIWIRNFYWTSSWFSIFINTTYSCFNYSLPHMNT